MLNTLRAYGGMVTAPHHLASQAGAAVLREGGNALEAMLAMAATIAVVYPHMNSIGGDGFWLTSVPGEEPIGIQACGPAAQLATPGFYAEHRHSHIPSRGPLAALTVAGTGVFLISASHSANLAQANGRESVCSSFNSLQIRTGNFPERTAKPFNGTGTGGRFKSGARSHLYRTLVEWTQPYRRVFYSGQRGLP